jgi:hypothetical protein
MRGLRGEVPPEELQRVVERLHDARAHLRSVTSVAERFRGETVWEGAVHVFNLEGHPTATVCYAWSSFVGDTDQRRFYAVLGMPPVNSAADAVRASIVADRKAKRPT